MRDGLGRRAARRLATLGQRQHRSPARCHYAQILDGEHLWLSVAGPLAEDSRIVLFDEATGEATAVAADLDRTEAGISLSARIALTGPDAPRAFSPGDEVLLAVEEPEAAERHPVESDVDVAPAAPGRVPPTQDHTRHFSLKRDPAGALRVICTEVPPAALVRGLGQSGDSFEVTCRLPRRADAADVVLHDGDGNAVHRAPISGELDAVITLPLPRLSLPEGRFTMTVEAGDDQWPVMRTRNALRAPQQAVVLPMTVLDDGTGTPMRLALVYGRGGQLGLNIRPLGDQT